MKKSDTPSVETLEAPIRLTLDQLEAVAAASAAQLPGGGFILDYHTRGLWWNTDIKALPQISVQQQFAR